MSRFGGMTGISTESYVLTNLRHEGRVLGHLGEHLISEFVADESGHRYCFAGVALRNRSGGYDIKSLARDEWIVEPGLAYRWVADPSQVHYGQKLLRV